MVLKLKCFRKARSITWLLMTWPLMSLGHWQPWYWFYRRNGYLCPKHRYFNCLYRTRILNDWYVTYMATLSKITFVQWELKQHLTPKKVRSMQYTVYPKKYAHGFCFAVLCCGYTLTDCPISTRLTSLALWQSNDCPSASKATLMNMDKYFMWIHYERLHNHNKAKHNKTECIFLGIYCISENG